MMTCQKKQLIPLTGSLLCRVSLFLAEEDQDRLVQVDPRIRSTLDQQKKREADEHNDSSGASKKLFVVADAGTLLARLNTKRLRRRLLYLSKTKDLPAGETAFSHNKTTAELAIDEWNALIERSKQRDDAAVSFQLPSPFELLLFSPCPRPVTILASYPRSGNSLLRNLFERATLRVTGSDMRGGLTQHDLVGEAAVSAKICQFVKTHFPERVGSPTFPASRAVLLVRNPYDALESYFNLMMTNTHTTSLTEEQRKKTEKLFHAMALKEIQVWRLFHQFWLQSKIPILLVRYEDLIRHPGKVLSRVVQFVLEVKNMTFFHARIKQCVDENNTENVGAYKPRSGGIGKSRHRYPAHLLDKMNHCVYELMHQLGYGEMLVTSPTLWKLDPIPNFGFEIPAREKGKIIQINGGPVVRGPKLRTDWKSLRKELGCEAGQDDISSAYLE